MTPEMREAIGQTISQAFTPEVRAKMSAASRLAQSDPEVKAKIAERTKQQWADPAGREKLMVGIHANPTCEKKSEAAKASWDNAEIRQKRLEGMALADTSERREKRSNSFKQYLATPEGHKQWSEAATRTWEDEKTAQSRIDGMRQRHADIRQKLAEAERIPTLQEQIAKLQENLRLLEAIKGYKPNNQTVARLLIDNPALSNDEIGCILDDRRVSCPWGDSWQRELKRGHGAKWISVLRQKLRKLGMRV